MNRIFCLFYALLVPVISSAQSTPITPVETLNTFTGATSIFAPFELHSPYSGVGPVVIYNIAQVDYTAGERIRLKPGFQAGNFSGGGYFHAQIGVAPDFDVVFIEPNSSFPQVGQFEKLEFGIDLPASVQSQIDQFITSQFTSGLNPYDPEQISVEVNFTQGNYNYQTYGFYYRDFIRDPSTITGSHTTANLIQAQWLEQATQHPWRVRWAPPVTGQWNCSISVRLNNAINYALTVQNILFECVASSNQGWLEKGQSNWHLRFNGTHNSFFALGQNIAWNDPWLPSNQVDHPSNWCSSFNGQEITVGPNNYPMYGGAGYLDVLDWTLNLAENGGNMVRFVSRPLSFNFEWEHLTNYHEGMTRAWELDQMFDLCEQNNMKIFFCMEFHPQFGNRANEAEWDFNPYNLEIPGVDHPDDFLDDAFAKKKYQAKLRYFFARWGYSTSLGVFELLSEMDGWRYFDHNTPYKDNEDAEDLQYNWHLEMLHYAKQITTYRPLLTSSCYGAVDAHELQHPVFNLNSLDITTNHHYAFPRNMNNQRFEEFHNPVFNRGTHNLWSDKPTVFDEMGLDRHGDADQNDVEGCQDVTFHNALWASSMMGGIGTGFNWWQWFNDQYREDNFPPASNFFSGIDFETGNFVHPDFWDDAGPLNLSHDNSTIEVYYNTANSRNKTMGWVHNCSYYWGNMNEACYDRDNDQMPVDEDVNDDEDISTPTELPAGTKFEIHGLNNLANYEFEYFPTRNNTIVVGSASYQTNIFGTLKPYWINSPIADWAFKAYRPGNQLRVEFNEYDTLRCGENVVVAEGNHELDSLGTFLYSWNFGNGQTSQLRIDTAIYDSPGVYLVVLVVSDTLGWSDTLEQSIVVLECSNARHSYHEHCAVSDGLTVSPNPTTGFSTIAWSDSFQAQVIVEVYSPSGQLLLSVHSESDRVETLDLSFLSAGIYYISVSDGIGHAIRKISVTD
jgi:hypothetical protein